MSTYKKHLHGEIRKKHTWLPFLSKDIEQCSHYVILNTIIQSLPKITVLYLITAHISAQSSNSVVFRLQPVYF